jgi:hypothetical protein
MTEKFNQVLVNMISAYVKKNQKYWDTQLPLLTAAYRSCEHEATGYTPNRLMLGREVFLPIQLILGSSLQDLTHGACDVNGYVTDLRDKMHATFAHVREHLQKAQTTQKRNYDSRMAVNNYAVGSMVYVLDSTRTVGLSPKLSSDKWKGPQLITRKISELLFEIKSTVKSRTKIIHHNRLKPYHGDEVPDWISKWRSSVEGKAVISSNIPDNRQSANLTGTQTNAPAPSTSTGGPSKRPRGRPKKYQQGNNLTDATVIKEKGPPTKNSTKPASGVCDTDGTCTHKTGINVRCPGNVNKNLSSPSVDNVRRGNRARKPTSHFQAG